MTDFKERRTFRTSPANVALERDFHTIDVPGDPPDVVEKKLADFEGDLGPAIMHILETCSLADESDRAVLFFFMALLTIKNPRMRKTVGEWMGDVAESEMKMKAADAAAWEADMARAKAEGTIPEDADTNELRKLVLQGAFTYGVSVPGHLHMEFNLVDKLLPYFHDRRWLLCKGPADRSTFITSDNPVCLMWQNPKVSEPPGLGRRGTQIVFPVANELTIIGTYEGRDCTVEAGNELTAVINGNVLPHVGRQVYARGDDFTYAMPHNPRTMRGTELLDDPVNRPDEEPTT